MNVKKTSMSKKLWIFLIPLFFLGLSVAVDTTDSIDNPSFEDVTLNGSLGIYFPDDWTIGDPTHTQLTADQLYLVNNNALDGFISTNASSGSFSYANVFDFDTWDYNFTYDATDIHAYQLITKADTSHFTVSGDYMIKTAYSGAEELINGKIVFGGLVPSASGSLEIDLNVNASYNTWKSFEVEYDNGVCSVLSGDVSCSAFFDDIFTVNIYSDTSYQSAKAYYNGTMQLLVDNLEVLDVIELPTVDNYYDQYIQSLDAYYHHDVIYGVWADPSCTTIYSGKIDPNMKTRYLNITFDGCSFRRTGEQWTMYIDMIQYYNEDTSFWETMYNGSFPFYLINNANCLNDEVHYLTCLFGGNYGQFPIFRWNTQNNYFVSFGMIMPQEARMINITFRGWRGTTTSDHLCGSMNFTLSNITQTVDLGDRIDTSNAHQGNPTFFPVLTQAFEQNGTNMSAYHLNLMTWKYQKNDYDYPYKIFWEAQEMTSTSTGNLPLGSYVKDYYDTSGWGILTGDTLFYNSTSTHDYFNVTGYRPSSTYIFNSLEEGESPFCPSQCVLGTYQQGTYSNGSCYYSNLACDSRCLPDGIDVSVYSVGTDTVTINFTSFDTNYWYLEDDNSTVIDGGSATVNYVIIEDLEADSDYTFYVNGTEKYGCPLVVSNSTAFTTLEFSEVPEDLQAIQEAIREGGQAINDWITIALTGFGSAIGVNEAVAKDVAWLIITLITAIGVTVYLGSQNIIQGDQTFYAFGFTALIMLGIGWAMSWLNPLWLLLIAIPTGLALFGLFKGGMG